MSFDLSGKIDQLTIQALLAVKREADALSIPFFVVGASARDYILKHCYGLEPARMTRDVDLGVEVAGWDQFKRLTDSLINKRRFTSSPERQRFFFGTLPIDIVPFGSVANEDKKISWPPEHEIVMSVVGFEEAYRSSMLIRLSSDPALEIRLPTLPGLALMKIISWEDRYPERKKDAEDLLFIMNNYEQAGNFDRLYDHEQKLLKEENFDTQLASIRLLGRDMAIIADHSTTKMVRNILDSETGHKSQYRLIADMIQNTIMFENNFDEILLKIEKLIRGFVETEQNNGGQG